MSGQQSCAVCRRAVYLGFAVRPEAEGHRWDGSARKYDRRLRQIHATASAAMEMLSMHREFALSILGDAAPWANADDTRSATSTGPRPKRRTKPSSMCALTKAPLEPEQPRSPSIDMSLLPSSPEHPPFHPSRTAGRRAFAPTMKLPAHAPPSGTARSTATRSGGT